MEMDLCREGLRMLPLCDVQALHCLQNEYPCFSLPAQVALPISLLPDAVCDSTVISSRVFVTRV